jgi:MOSC domain-containing protein YiiM
MEVVSSIVRTPFDGPLLVHELSIEGDSFENTKLHGIPDRVMYVLGLNSLRKYLNSLGLDIGDYKYGTLGENITLDEFDPSKISVGDIYEFGEGEDAVIAQVTSPRFPCNRVNYALKSEDALPQLRACGGSGVYFRILIPGKIYGNSRVTLIERAKVHYSLVEFYDLVVNRASVPSEAEYKRIMDNGALPLQFVETFTKQLRMLGLLK